MMQRLITPLRVCRICGLEANTEAELEQFFVRNTPSTYGYLNRCKKCHREDMKQRMQRTGEFIKIFRARSTDGRIRCYFCGEEVTKLRGSWGDSLFIHSLDENHENWNPTNKVPTHNACHVQYHKTGEKNPSWTGDEASDSAKYQRIWEKKRKAAGFTRPHRRTREGTMSECVLCHKIMKRGTKPRTVIDWDTLKVVGQAHTGCVRKKSKYEDIRFYPGDIPSPEQIAFSKKLRDFMLAANETWLGHKWPPHEFHKYLLASAALFRVSTSKQWAQLTRVRSLTDWWLNGSKTITQKEYDALFEWISSFGTKEGLGS